MLSLVGLGGSDYQDANLPAPEPGWTEGGGQGAAGKVPEHDDDTTPVRRNGNADTDTARTETPATTDSMSASAAFGAIPGLQKTQSEMHAIHRERLHGAARGVTIPARMQTQDATPPHAGSSGGGGPREATAPTAPPPAPAATSSSHPLHPTPQGRFNGPGPQATQAADQQHCAIDILQDPNDLDKWRPEPELADAAAKAAANKGGLVKEEYIPLRLARAKMKLMAAEMAKLKQQHLMAIERVEQHYGVMKVQAEEKVKEYVKQLAVQHQEEMKRYRREHREKMRTVRQDLLGNVDKEVESARQRVLKYEAEQEDVYAVHQRKIEHEKQLFEEHKAKQLGVVEEQRRAAEAKVAQLEAEVAALRKAHSEELAARIADTEAKAEEALAVKVAESEQALSKRLEEEELKKSVVESELKIARDAVAKEKDAIEQERKALADKMVEEGGCLRVEIENKQAQFNTLYATAKKGHAKIVAYRHHAGRRIQENLEMQAHDIHQQYAARIAEMRDTHARAVEALEEKLAGAEVDLKTHAEASVRSKEDVAKWDEERAAFAAKITALEDSTRAADEAETLQKASKVDQLQQVTAALKALNGSLADRCAALAKRCAASHDGARAAVARLVEMLIAALLRHQGYVTHEKGVAAALAAARCGGDADANAKAAAATEGALDAALAGLRKQVDAADGGADAAARAALAASRESIAAAAKDWTAKVDALALAGVAGAAETVAKVNEHETLLSEQEKALVGYRETLLDLSTTAAAARKDRDAARAAHDAKTAEALKALDADIAAKEKELAALRAAPLAYDATANGHGGDVEAPDGPSPDAIEAAEEARQADLDALRGELSTLTSSRTRAAADAERETARLEQEAAAADTAILTKASAAVKAMHAAWGEYREAVNAARAVVDAAGSPLTPTDADTHEAMGAKIVAIDAHTTVHAQRDAFADACREHVLEYGLAGVAERMVDATDADEVARKLHAVRNAGAIAAATAAAAMSVAGGAGAGGSAAGAPVDPEVQKKLQKAVEEKKALAKQLKQVTADLEVFKGENAEASKAQAEAARALEAKLQEDITRLEKVAEQKGVLEEALSAVKDEATGLRSDVERLEKVAGTAAETEKELQSTKEELSAAQGEVKKLNKEQVELRAVAEDAQAVKDELKSTKKEAAHLRKDNTEKTDMYRQEAILRKKYFNEVQDLKGKIRVMVRCRPMNSIEKSKNSEEVVGFPDEYNITVPEKNKDWVFDQCFDPKTSQEKVWENSKHFVQSCIDGYNTCIFAYGQTGSGKTFTMEGSAEMPGLTPRCISEIFDTLNGMSAHHTWSVRCYMTELYTDNLHDLLLDRKKYKNASEFPALDIKKGDKGIVEISGITIIDVASAEELATEYMRGCKQRHVRSTGMNESSSRSHLVFGILTRTVSKKDGKVVTGKMSLVDLAGSERMDKTGIKDEQGQKEAKSINKSLTALGDVIATLSSDPGGFIPYRNHKLTMLMSDSLGGNAKTMMIAAVSPASYNMDETCNTLGYASRAKNITNDASKAAESKEIAKLKGQIGRMQAAMAEAGVSMDGGGGEQPSPTDEGGGGGGKLDAPDKKTREKSPGPSPSGGARRKK